MQEAKHEVQEVIYHTLDQKHQGKGQQKKGKEKKPNPSELAYHFWLFRLRAISTIPAIILPQLALKYEKGKHTEQCEKLLYP